MDSGKGARAPKLKSLAVLFLDHANQHDRGHFVPKAHALHQRSRTEKRPPASPDRCSKGARALRMILKGNFISCSISKLFRINEKGRVTVFRPQSRNMQPFQRISNDLYHSQVAQSLRTLNEQFICDYSCFQLRTCNTLSLSYKNMFYKNSEVEISEILRINPRLKPDTKYIRKQKFQTL